MQIMNGKMNLIISERKKGARLIYCLPREQQNKLTNLVNRIYAQYILA